MKNTFCLARGSEAVLSQHFGDLGEEGVEQQWRSALQLMQEHLRVCAAAGGG
jgi:hydrogenase maturation protein HypF